MPAASLLPLHDADSINRSLSHLPRTTSALLFHTSDHALAMVTAHTVEHDDAGLPHIAAGRPLTPADERHVIDLLLGREAGPVEILPASVLARAPGTLMWWMAPGVRPMHLKLKDGRSLTVQTRWPSLVLLVLGRTLFVAAAAGEERPDASTPLHHAPLPNIFADCRVCTGSAKLPTDNRLADMDGWEEVITGTWWTHDNHAGAMVAPTKSKKKRGSAQADDNHRSGTYWAGRDGEFSPFPDRLLAPLGMTLADWPAYLSGDAASLPAHRRRR